MLDLCIESLDDFKETVLDKWNPKPQGRRKAAFFRPDFGRLDFHMSVYSMRP
jgi:hypothetical protein